MEGGLVSDKLLNALVDSLSVEDLEAILSQKIAMACPDHKPKPMSERKNLKKQKLKPPCMPYCTVSNVQKT